MSLNPAFETLLADMRDNPGDWREDDYCLRKGSVSVWLANGFFFYGFYMPVKLAFSFVEKIRFTIALTAWRKMRIARILLEANEAQRRSEAGT